MSKGLEELKKPCCVNIPFDESENEYTYTQKQVNVIEKELKALEIIKNKIVDMPLLFETFNYYKYGLKVYNTMRTRGYGLTQEEYDLLKEVML